MLMILDRWRPIVRLLAWGGLLIWLLSSRPAQAAVPGTPAVQASGGAAGFYYLLPQGQDGVLLDTHTATIRVEPGDDGVVRASVDALYRLDNNAKNPVAANLRVASEGGGTPAPIEGIELTIADTLVALQAGEGGSYTGQVPVGADMRVALRLRYRIVLGSAPLTTIRYGSRVLQQWNSSVSLRIDLRVPDAIAGESWTQVTPVGWSYTASGEAGVTGIKWLYDGYLPDQAFVFQFVSPVAWRQLNEAEQAAAFSTPDAAVRLGELYRRLAGDAAAQNDVRQRFYAQAVAAYAASIAAQSDPASAEAAVLHVGLASLYRSRVVETTGAQAIQYAQLMVEEAHMALEALPSEDSRRRELTQWQADGLRILLNQARARQEWEQALAILTTLSALPPELVDQGLLEEDRRMVTVQQALQLMEQGDREAALAAAGPEITAVDLMPPPHFRSLFASWHVTVSVALHGMELLAEARPAGGRSQDALASVQEIATLWRAGIRAESVSGYTIEARAQEVNGQEAGVAPELETPVYLYVRFPAEASAVTLARLLPPSADWAFLRTLLLQMGTGAQQEPNLLWQRVSLNQPMDLHMAADQWGVIAAGLEQQAADFERQSTAPSAFADAAGIEAAFQARIRAVNYREAAHEWRRLARESWLLYQFVVDDPLLRVLIDGDSDNGNSNNGDSDNGSSGAVRSWFATASAPSQVFIYETQMISAGRLAGFAALSLVSISLLAAVLWSLM